MEVLTVSTRPSGNRRFVVAGLALVAILLATTRLAADDVADMVPDVVVKAALLYNFAKFTEWPGLTTSGAIVFCVVADDGIADALVETVSGQKIGGHTLSVFSQNHGGRPASR